MKNEDISSKSSGPTWFKKLTFWAKPVNFEKSYDYNGFVLDLYFEIPYNILGVLTKKHRYKYGVICADEVDITSLLDADLTGVVIICDNPDADVLKQVSDHNEKRYINNPYWNKKTVSIYDPESNTFYKPYILKETLFERFIKEDTDGFLLTRKRPL